MLQFIKKEAKSLRRGLLALVLMFGLASVGCARQDSEVDIAAATETANQFLQASDLRAKQVRYDGELGWYEVVIPGGDIVYLDRARRHLFIGDVIRLKNKVNVTAERAAALNRVDFSRLPLDEAVKVVQGDGSLKIAVFTDPDCPYCHKLEKDFGDIDNITIYNFLYPIGSLHPEAPQKAKNIWCQAPQNRSRVWVDYMRRGKSIPKASDCMAPLAAIHSLAEDLRVKGTPFIILPDGKILGGYIDKQEFIKLLNRYRK